MSSRSPGLHWRERGCQLVLTTWIESVGEASVLGQYWRKPMLGLTLTEVQPLSPSPKRILAIYAAMKK